MARPSSSNNVIYFAKKSFFGGGRRNSSRENKSHGTPFVIVHIFFVCRPCSEQIDLADLAISDYETKLYIMGSSGFIVYRGHELCNFKQLGGGGNLLGIFKK